MTTKLSLRALIAAFGITGAGLASLPAYADLFVISNSATQIDAGDIKDIYKGDKQFIGSTKLIPVDNGPSQEAFLANVLKMDAPRYNTIWTKKSFREGLNPPSVKSGDTEVLDYVRKTPGAVGYVGSSPNGVNVVHKY